jgi:ATP-dependent Lon protease
MNTEAEPPVSEEPFVAAPRQLSALDQKILHHFPGLVVRKDLTNGLKQNAVVPTYVLEYLLGQHCATDDNDVIKAGLESVQKILAKHYVHRNQAQLVKSTIKEKGRHKVIDKLTVELNDKGGFYEAEFTNLGLKKVPVSDDFVRRYPKLLVGGIWCITDVTYEVAEDPKASPWQIDTLKPIQVASVDYEEFLKGRAQFTTDEWIDVLMQSMGFNPEMFGRRAKLLTLVRLIPYCERNYNLLELGPKGTGKSHIYAEFSPHGMLISGSEVTAPKLFVSNASGKIGLVGYWDCVCFDEFAGKDKKVDKALVDIMKNYMANRTFSRGIEQLSAEASMVFMGNTKKSVAYMLKHSHFFDPLPDKYIDSAFLDRIHAFNPGWEVAPVRHELFTNGYGFIVDFISEVLKHLRTEDYTGAYKKHFEVTSEVSTRDQTGFEKTFSGLMKILFPDGNATAAEIEEILAFSMEARRRVREHILRIDDTFKRNDFIYRPLDGGAAVTVRTPEEIQFRPSLAREQSPRTKELARRITKARRSPPRTEWIPQRLRQRPPSL